MTRIPDSTSPRGGEPALAEYRQLTESQFAPGAVQALLEMLSPAEAPAGG